MEHRDVFILETIIDFCDRIADSLAGANASFQDFSENIDLQDVCAFRVLQIGENVNNLSSAFKERYSQIPWSEISGLRNIVAHEYGNIESEILWKTIMVDVPKLREFCAKIIR